MAIPFITTTTNGQDRYSGTIGDKILTKGIRNPLLKLCGRSNMNVYPSLTATILVTVMASRTTTTQNIALTAHKENFKFCINTENNCVED